MVKYIQETPDRVFSKVHFLIYVFDIQFTNEERDLKTYSDIIEKLFQYSKDAQVFILLHKADMIESKNLDSVF